MYTHSSQKPLYYAIFFLAEVSLKKSFKCLAVSCLVSCHLMNCIMDCIKVRSLSSLSNGRHGKAFEGLLKRYQVPILAFKKGIHLEKVPTLSQTIVTERLILCDITSFHFTMDIEKEIPKYLLIIKLCNLCIIDY